MKHRQLEITRELYSFTFPYEPYLNSKSGYNLKMRVEYREIYYLFDPYSYIICRSDSDDAEYIEDAIRFPAIPQIEVMKAYVGQLNNRQLQKTFEMLNEQEYMGMFWNCFDDGFYTLNDVGDFERYYRYARIIEWCEHNHISYYIKDERIKKDLKL